MTTTNALGAGSGRPGITREPGDFSVAGVATRVVTVAPQDSDWGDTPPPIGTMVLEQDGIFWMKTAAVGGWKSAVLF